MWNDKIINYVTIGRYLHFSQYLHLLYGCKLIVKILPYSGLKSEKNGTYRTWTICFIVPCHRQKSMLFEKKFKQRSHEGTCRMNKTLCRFQPLQYFFHFQPTVTYQKKPNDLDECKMKKIGFVKMTYLSSKFKPKSNCFI